MYTKRPFVPVQALKTSITVHNQTPWTPGDISNLCNQVPVPSSMESDQNRLTFHFKDEAEAVKAFEVLKKQGLTLEGLVDGMDIDALQAPSNGAGAFGAPVRY